MSRIGRQLARLGGVGASGEAGDGGARVDRAGAHGHAAARPDPADPAGPPGQASHPTSDGWDAFHAALGSTSTPVAPGRPRATSLPGILEPTRAGPVRTIRGALAHDVPHGGVSLARLGRVSPSALARFALDAGLEDADPAGMVFLDTETTGLAGGTGTVPFLVGVGALRESTFETEQWLLERHGEEAPILEALSERLARASILVTYNGKSFDWPLLRARYVLHRMKPPAVPYHLDLLHGARRVFGRRLASVRARDVERELLGFVRTGDIEGSEIPEVFFGLARTGYHPDLGRVVEHHRLDIVGMAAMLVRFAEVFTGAARPEFEEDALACARVLSRATESAESASVFDTLVDGVARTEAHLLRARRARRAGEVDGERELLERAVAAAADEAESEVALVALVKCLEHRGRDLEAARDVAARLLREFGGESHAARLARLELRLARAREAAAPKPPRRRRARTRASCSGPESE